MPFFSPQTVFFLPLSIGLSQQSLGGGGALGRAHGVTARPTTLPAARKSDRQTYLGPRPSLQLRLDAPRQVRLAVLVQQLVRADGVQVLSVDQQTVHVEETGADGRRGAAAVMSA